RRSDLSLTGKCMRVIVNEHRSERLRRRTSAPADKPESDGRRDKQQARCRYDKAPTTHQPLQPRSARVSATFAGNFRQHSFTERRGDLLPLRVLLDERGDPLLCGEELFAASTSRNVFSSFSHLDFGQESMTRRTWPSPQIKVLSGCAALHKLILDQSPLPRILTKLLTQQAMPAVKARRNSSNRTIDDLSNLFVAEVLDIR